MTVARPPRPRPACPAVSRPVPRVCGLLLGALLLPGFAVSAEASEPAARARVVREKLAGAPRLPFDFRGYVLREGAPWARVSLRARPEADGWAVREEVVPERPDGEHLLTEALLGPRLELRSGTYHRRAAQHFLRATFEATAGGRIRLVQETDEYQSRIEPECDQATSTLTAALLFVRAVLADEATYDLADFDPTPMPGDGYVAPMRIRMHGKANWRVHGGVRPARIASLTRGTQTLRLALDPADGALLGLEVVGVPYQFVPEGSGPVGLAQAGQQQFETDVERAVARTRALRAAMPLPDRALAFEADVLHEGFLVGHASLRAEPVAHAGRPAWSVVETRVLVTGASRVEYELSGLLGRDVALLRGERIERRPEGAAQLTFERQAEGFAAVVHEPDGVRRPAQLLGAPAGATLGLVPLLLFLRAAPATPAHYVLSGWDPRFATQPKAGDGAFALQAADVHVELLGEAMLETPAGPRRSLKARCQRRSGGVFDVHLDVSDRSLLAVVGHLPRLTLWPRGTGGAPVDWYEAVEGEPRTPRQAFVKFGRGYHTARRDLLAASLHWPALRAKAVAEGRYPEGVDEEQVRNDWIEVFLAMSKHRTEGDCDDLLCQIFVTSRHWTDPDGSFLLETLPPYGGHTYRLRELEGRWWIVAID